MSKKTELKQNYWAKLFDFHEYQVVVTKAAKQTDTSEFEFKATVRINGNEMSNTFGYDDEMDMCFAFNDFDKSMALIFADNCKKYLES